METLPAAASEKAGEEEDKTCEGIARRKPEEPPEAILHSITLDATVLPLFQLEIFNRMRQKNYSLINNERLRCQWSKFCDNMTRDHKRKAYKFPSTHDYHFYNCINRYAPEHSLNGKNFRKHLTHELYVDDRGHHPVAHELHTRKTRPKLKSGRKRKTI